VYAFDGQRLSPQTIRKIAAVPGSPRVQPPDRPPNTFFAAGVAVHNKGGGGAGHAPPEAPGIGRVTVLRRLQGSGGSSSGNGWDIVIFLGIFGAIVRSLSLLSGRGSL